MLDAINSTAVADSSPCRLSQCHTQQSRLANRSNGIARELTLGVLSCMPPLTDGAIEKSRVGSRGKSEYLS
jgi:hypothetical protein